MTALEDQEVIRLESEVAEMTKQLKDARRALMARQKSRKEQVCLCARAFCACIS